MDSLNILKDVLKEISISNYNGHHTFQGICPVTIMDGYGLNLKKLKHNELKSICSAIDLIRFISIKPQRDTSEKLKKSGTIGEFLSSLKKNSTGLTQFLVKRIKKSSHFKIAIKFFSINLQPQCRH